MLLIIISFRFAGQKSSLPTIPTISYTVGNRDTLTSVAARFDTTPSELTHLNRLNSSFIYPGQQLLVPDKKAKDKDDASSSSTHDLDGGSLSGKSSPVERKLSGDESREKGKLRGNGAIGATIVKHLPSSPLEIFSCPSPACHQVEKPIKRTRCTLLTSN